MISISETKPTGRVSISQGGRQYTVEPVGRTQRSMFRAAKIAAGKIAQGRAATADHELVAKISTPAIEAAILGASMDRMTADGLPPEQIHAFATVAFHFHTDGIRAAKAVSERLNRKAAA